MELVLAGVDVADGEQPAGDELAVLVDVARRIAGDGRGIVGARKGYVYGRPAQCPIAEPDRVGKLVDHGLSRGERVQGAGVIFNLAVGGEGNAGAALAIFNNRNRILGDQVQIAIVGGIIDRPKRLGVSAKVVRHDIEVEDLVFLGTVEIVLRLRRIAH